MRDTAVSSTPRRRRSLRRAFTAFAAVPTALALGSGLFAAAPATAVDVTNQAQNSLFGSSDVTDYLETDGVPQRTPIRTDEHPSIQGLPSGVSVERVEWITERRIALFIRSAAMPKELIQVQVLLARDWHSNPSAKYPEVWALDGLRALDTESGWTINTNIEQFYADKNVNVILPVGGESSFYSDWQKPDNGKHYKWETFMTKELPAVLQNGYRSNGERAVFGLSMGGTAAINLAERNPDMFKFVGSFSGYLDTTSMGMAQAISAAQSDADGYNSEAMWGQPGSQDWIDHDPKLGIDALKGKAVYVSSGSGADDFGQPGSVANGPANPAGVGLEILSRMTTQTFVDRAKKSNVDVTAVFRPSGVHNWPYWQFEMTQAWPYIADSLKLAQADRGADCATQGAIAEVTKSNAFGACVNNEYDVKGGKAQDFRGGRAYWSPETGAHVLFGRIGARYSEFGGPDSWLGHPTSGEKATPDGKGRYVHFQNGSIYWTAETGARALPKDIFDAWGSQGWEGGSLGYPTEDTVEHNGNYIQKFQGGYVIRTKDKGAYAVHGEIAKKYASINGVESSLGAPVSGEQAISGGALQTFQHGAIYWSPSTGAHFIMNGNIRDAWGKQGWENGAFGWPTADQEKIQSGGEKMTFQHGTISEVNGRIVEEKK